MALLFLALGALTVLPWVSPALALALGAAFSLTLGNPFPERSRRAATLLLKASVVGLGFGMSLGAVVRAGSAGFGFTVGVIAGTLVLGLLLGRALGVRRDAALLISAGTSICGGSAIAAVGAAVDADADSMSVALATVFVLNAAALYLFPLVGHQVGLSEGQFGVWAAVAIHDTSSVVGAAASYGPRALADATVLKLARALWIVPLTLGVVLARRWSRGSEERTGAGRMEIPWFIGLFLLATLVRTVAPDAAVGALDAAAWLARRGLVLTLFLIGAGLSRATVRTVGGRSFAQGLVLWIVVASATLWAIVRGLPV